MTGSLICFYDHGVVREGDQELPCTVVRYRTPGINVIPVVEELLDNSEFPPPWRTVVTSNWRDGVSLSCVSESRRYVLDPRDRNAVAYS